ncbi:MAG: hypothetical protein L0322_25490, partial [Chloroflexi bacterium]|nr:hypothetical protein [Chloroflexota bacterium]
PGPTVSPAASQATARQLRRVRFGSPGEPVQRPDKTGQPSPPESEPTAGQAPGPVTPEPAPGSPPGREQPATKAVPQPPPRPESPRPAGQPPATRSLRRIRFGDLPDEPSPTASQEATRPSPPVAPPPAGPVGRFSIPARPAPEPRPHLPAASQPALEQSPARRERPPQRHSIKPEATRMRPANGEARRRRRRRAQRPMFPPPPPEPGVARMRPASGETRQRRRRRAQRPMFPPPPSWSKPALPAPQAGSEGLQPWEQPGAPPGARPAGPGVGLLAERPATPVTLEATPGSSAAWQWPPANPGRQPLAAPAGPAQPAPRGVNQPAGHPELQPDHRWPSLPEEEPLPAEEWESAWRGLERRYRLNREQQGLEWNELPF